jgi:hypothetical protein
MRFPRSACFFLALVGACNGDDSGPADAGGDGSDATTELDAARDADAAPLDAASDGGGGPADSSANDAYYGDATPLGDGACTTPPFANVTSTCTSINCMSDKGVQCVGDAAACTNIDGYNTGRVLECGTPSDCGGLYCCLSSTISFTPGCPNNASFGADTRATNCAPSDAGCYGIRICRIDADCAGTNHKCTDTVFGFGQDAEPAHFGICW